jgi:putative Ca2+/H+ antiporter (TMEM165/GDT1 family)
MIEALAVSTGVVALGEMGDKTQLLALLLAARYRRPWTIAAGILVATAANHLLAASVGSALAHWIDPRGLKWLLGLSFIAVAAWMLVPDRQKASAGGSSSHLGVFGITLVAFFLAEMGDKTQVATVMLAARYDSLTAVVAGTTLGLMLANVPALWLGDTLLRRVPLQWVRALAALVFALLGVIVLLSSSL